MRGISVPLAAKLLTMLAQEGLVEGAPGPGGGYKLSKIPSKITLLEIVRVFEKTDRNVQCPFGSGWCGKGNPCPLHDRIMELNDAMDHFLSRTTLAVFVKKEKRD